MKITRALMPAALLCAALAACTSDSPAGIEPGEASENSGIMFGSGNRGEGQDTSSTESGTVSSDASGGIMLGSGNAAYTAGQDTIADPDGEGSAGTQESGGGFLFGSGN
jgi:hypothetical protein